MRYLRTKRAIQSIILDSTRCSISRRETNHVLVLPGISGFDVIDVIEKFPNVIVYGVERDIRVYNVLKNKFRNYDNVKIILSDIQEFLTNTDVEFNLILLDTFSKWGTYLKMLVEYSIFSGVLKKNGSIAINFVGNRESKSEQEIQKEACKRLLGKSPDNNKERRIAAVNSFLWQLNCPSDPPKFYKYKSGSIYMYFFVLNIRNESYKVPKYRWSDYKNNLYEINVMSFEKERELNLVLESDGYQEALERSKFLLSKSTSLSDNIKEGLKRAQKNGVKIGRPKTTNDQIRLIKKLRNEEGLSIRKIAAHKKVKVTKSTVERTLRGV